MATVTNTKSAFTPPLCTCGPAGNTLNRDMFRSETKLPSLTFNKTLTKSCIKALKTRIVPRKHFKALRDDSSNPDNKIILLNPELVSSNDYGSLGEEGAAFIRENHLEDGFCEMQVQLEYTDWSSEEVLRSLLPGDVEVPTGFSRIGHILHLNLRQEQLAYKHVIGQVLMDKNPGITTVVNKTGEINNEFRFFDMELLAGEDNMETIAKEHRHSFKFDFSKVYWNSRLSTEHARIVALLNECDVVHDVFAGVGPFAIPAARKRCLVTANDRNHESYKWLNNNINLNKIKKGMITTFNLDGRDFIRTVIQKDLIKQVHKSSTDKFSNHVIMNLPSLAIEFLDAFLNLLSNEPPDIRTLIILPTVHCYCFSKEIDLEGDVRRRIEAVLKCPIGPAVIHDVRNVAPNKEMMCVSFKMPADAIFGAEKGSNYQSDEGQPPTKKSRTECVTREM